jgi:hypothetical protein
LRDRFELPREEAGEGGEDGGKRGEASAGAGNSGTGTWIGPFRLIEGASVLYFILAALLTIPFFLCYNSRLYLDLMEKFSAQEERTHSRPEASGPPSAPGTYCFACERGSANSLGKQKQDEEADQEDYHQSLPSTLAHPEASVLVSSSKSRSRSPHILSFQNASPTNRSSIPQPCRSFPRPAALIERGWFRSVVISYPARLSALRSAALVSVVA